MSEIDDLRVEVRNMRRELDRLSRERSYLEQLPNFDPIPDDDDLLLGLHNDLAGIRNALTLILPAIVGVFSQGPEDRELLIEKISAYLDGNPAAELSPSTRQFLSELRDIIYRLNAT